MRRLVIATKNKGKVRELAEMLADLPFEVVSLEDYSEMPEVEETGSTFKENAVLKATAVANYTGEISVADDSGLEIEALGGAPGIYSSRFAGEGADDKELWGRVLRLMEHVRDDDRAAKFVCVAAVAFPEGKVKTCEGTCEGVILREPRGTGGFGYDPIFYVPELGKTMAELPPETKNRISHRAKAIQCVKDALVADCYIDS